MGNLLFVFYILFINIIVNNIDHIGEI